MRMLKRIAVGLGATIVVLGILVAATFFFGKPVAPPTPLAESPPATAPPAAPPTATGPLAIEVPGCVCHSDDPQVVADHATYRMSQCFDCPTRTCCRPRSPTTTS
jgi:hypothetical protein